MTSSLKNEKILLFTLGAVQFTNIMDFMIMMPMAPLLRETFHISPQQFGLLVSIYSIAAGISGLISAFWADKFDRKQVLFYLYLGFVIGTFSCGIAPSYYILLIARALTGIFGGILGATVLSIVADLIPYERRGAAMGTVMMAFSFAATIGVPFGLFLSTTFSWHFPFFAVAIFGVAILLLIWKFIPSVDKHLITNQPQENPIHRFMSVLRNTNQLRALSLMVLMIMGQFSVVPFISMYLVANVGLSPDKVFYVYLCGGSITLLTNRFVGKLSDNYGKWEVFTLMALLSTIPLWLITNLTPMPLVLILCVSSLFFLFISGRSIPASAMISGTASAQNRGTFMSLNSFVQQIASGVAAYLAGLVVKESADGKWENYHYVGYFAIFMTIMAIFMAKTLKIEEVQNKDLEEKIAEIGE
jgi:predicted MFS family arabinose efflux permease